MTNVTLLRRQFVARPWPTLLLALVVALASALATAVPRMVTDLNDRQLSQRLGSLSAIQGDVTGTWTPSLHLDGVTRDPWEGYRQAAEAIRLAQPEPLRSLLAPAQFVAEFATTWSAVPPPSSGYYTITFHLLVDPALDSHTHLVDGTWPVMAPDDRANQEIAVAAPAAERMGWQVGDSPATGYVISGIFEPNDAADVRWEHVELGRRYTEINDPNQGVELVVGAFLPNEMAGGDPMTLLQASFPTTLWYRLDPTKVGQAGLDVDLLNSQLTGLLAPSWEISAVGDDEPSGKSVRLTSELGPILTTVASAQATTRTLAAVSAAGPAGVAVAVLVLAAGLVADRRRTTLTLLSARGLSVRQQRGLATAEGLVVGLPAAALGHLVASWLAPGVDSWQSWLVTLCLAGVPAAALVASLSGAAASRPGGRPSRAAGSGRWRIVGEALVLLAAAAATFRLVTAPASIGIDWLAIAAPLLLALSVCLAVLRAYRVPLRALHKALGRGTGLTGFLGSARALRQPAGGQVPVVALVLGTTLAVTSAVLLGTISSATAQQTWDRVGADVKLSGPIITDDLVEALRGIDGVAAVSRIRDATRQANLELGGKSTGVRVWLAEPSLPEVYRTGGSTTQLPAEFFGEDGAAPIVVGGVPGGDAGTLGSLGEVRVAGRATTLPGVLSGSPWALMSVTRWPGGDQIRSNLALISLAPGADPAAVAAAVQEAAPTAKVESAAVALDALRQTPTLTSLSAIFTLLTASTVVLLLVAICTAQLLASPSRAMTGAVLRTLGLSRSRLRALTAWELVPTVLTSLAVGVGAGVGIAALLLANVDFAVLTGGTTAPALHLDPLGTGAVVGALVLATALSILLSAALAGRVEVATQLRSNDE